MADFPWWSFYGLDWLSNANLSRVSTAARGVWIDMLCLMDQSEQRGVFVTGGKPWTTEEVASAVRGGDKVAQLVLVNELLDAGVAKRRDEENSPNCPDGAIFSGRMVRDEALRRNRARAGAEGGSKRQANAKQTPSKTEAKRKQTPSKHPSNPLTMISNSDSDSDLDQGKSAPKKPWRTVEPWRLIYEAYPRKVAPETAKGAITRALKKIADRHPTLAAADAWLLARVQLYATSRVGKESKFTPYPASWMNGGRFDEDSKGWFKDDRSSDRLSSSAGRVHARPGKYDDIPVSRADDAEQVHPAPADGAA